MRAPTQQEGVQAVDAAMTNDIQTLVLLIEQGVDLSQVDVGGRTLLSWSAENEGLGFIFLLDMIDELGLDINKGMTDPRSSDDYSPLGQAIVYSNVSGVKKLLELSVDLKPNYRGDNTNFYDRTFLGMYDLANCYKKSDDPNSPPPGGEQVFEMIELAYIKANLPLTKTCDYCEECDRWRPNSDLKNGKCSECRYEHDMGVLWYEEFLRAVEMIEKKRED